MGEFEAESGQQQNIVDSFEGMFKHEHTAPPDTVFDHRMEFVDVPTVPTERYTSEEFHQLERKRSGARSGRSLGGRRICQTRGTPWSMTARAYPP